MQASALPLRIGGIHPAHHIAAANVNLGQVASHVELEVGRVDLANLPTLGLSETELLRRYLNKDHAFRHKLFTAEQRGLIEDKLGITMAGDAYTKV